jgi:succinoglycan biosynthesis protein ExoA
MEYPPVSAVMPIRNEERYLAESVRHVLAQDYPGPLELVLAVGPSADRTEQIARELAAADPRVTVVANPTGRIPVALNLAVRTARHEVIARIDGHALLPPGYLRTAVATLAQTGAADVGGIMAAEGVTPFQQAVAWGLRSKAGVGSAAFHTGGGAGPTLSVYLGVYRRAAIEAAGGWDEGMLRAEDWDLNFRIRTGGGVIWFTPGLRVTYRPRASIRTLAAQYFHYGRWRRVIVREHPDTASFRYLAPPGAAGLVAVGLAAGLAGLAAAAAGAPPGWRWLTTGFVIPVTYLAGISAVGLALSRGVPAAVRLRVPVVLGVMHLSWGSGFLTSPRHLHRRHSRESDTRVGQPDAARDQTAATGRE